MPSNHDNVMLHVRIMLVSIHSLCFAGAGRATGDTPIAKLAHFTAHTPSVSVCNEVFQAVLWINLPGQTEGT